MNPKSRALTWSHGVFTLETLGGMLGPTVFVLPNGAHVAPFHIAPWFAEDSGDLPGILQRLRGEWPCVPFGAASDRAATGRWPSSAVTEEPDANPHGYSSNSHWMWSETRPNALSLAIDYPEGHPIRRLERYVSGVDGEPALTFELIIEAREDCALPVGLHPVFRLNSEAGSMQLVASSLAAVTFPGPVDASSIFQPDAVTQDWRAVPLKAGGTIDPSILPLAMHTEELLQLIGADGRAVLINRPENYSVELTWDAADFPDLLLWFSNRGRAMPPWSGRHLALGVEPVRSAFDLGTGISTQPNPVNALGSPTALQLRGRQRFVTRYQVSVAQFTTTVGAE